MTLNPRFLAVASDPRIIPGVHHSCDEWCDYCPQTKRCLVFRCTDEFRKELGRRPGDPTFASIDEAVAFTREVAAIEGTTTDDLDALLAHPPGRSEIQTRDPLAAHAWEYAVRAALYLGPGAIVAACTDWRAEGPTPLEVVVWYHLRIYMRVFRALVGKERRSGRSADDVEEVMGSAKLALVSIERSRAALRALRTDADAADVAGLVALLDAIECGLDERFPGARSFVRLGLDVPVV
jgi:hypothetical protein